VRTELRKLQSARSICRTDHRTVTVPIMPGWIVQWYENVPVLGNVLLKVAPAAIVPEFHEPSSPVDVCASESLLIHVIVSPTPMAIGFGANAVFVKTDAFLTMDTGVPVAPVPPPDGVDGEYELHPMVKPINPATIPSRNVIFISIRLDTSQRRCHSKRAVHIVISEQNRNSNGFFVSEK
jgi:hypothetical protein